MWHSLLLGKWKELFFWLPIEELIQSRQKEYYDALAAADAQADSAEFVVLMLEITKDCLKEVTVVRRSTDQDSDQENDQDITSLKHLLAALGNDVLSAAEIMKQLGLSHKPTFRKNYLNPALAQNLIERTIPDKPTRSSSSSPHKKEAFPLLSPVSKAEMPLYILPLTSYLSHPLQPPKILLPKKPTYTPAPVLVHPSYR